MQNRSQGRVSTTKAPLVVVSSKQAGNEKQKAQEALWQRIRLSDRHVLSDRGAPTYQRFDQISSVYRYPDSFTDPTDGLQKNVMVLFSGNNQWRNEGISSRLFPVWSIARFFELNGSLFMKYAVKRYYELIANHPEFENTIRDAEDYVMDANRYFIEKTKDEQHHYDTLCSANEPYCHFPLQNTYADGGEVYAGVLTQYYAKIRGLIKDESDRLIRRNQVDTSDYSKTLIRKIKGISDLKKDALRIGFYVYLSLLNAPPTERDAAVLKLGLTQKELKTKIQRAYQAIRVELMETAQKGLENRQRRPPNQAGSAEAEKKVGMEEQTRSDPTADPAEGNDAIAMISAGVTRILMDTAEIWLEQNTGEGKRYGVL